MADGWRYLRLKPHEVESLTPREFAILMLAENERRWDDYDVLATFVMWNRAAYHAKRLKKSQLFKRPKNVGEMQKRQESLEEMRQETNKLNAWLARLRRKG